MIKSVKWIFVVLVFSSLISLSFRNDESAFTEGLRVGEEAPELLLCNQMQPLDLHAPAGSYTLLSFWASYDATSRLTNLSLNRVAEHNSRIKMISVSFDEYRSAFNASVRQDGLSDASCHWETEGEKSEIYKRYGLKSGFKNYLLDSEGKVVACNVTSDELTALLEK